MKRLLTLWMFLLPLLGFSANPNVPLYVRWDGTVAAPTQFLAAVFHAGGGIVITDNTTNLTISAVGGGSSTTNFVLTMGQDLTNLIYSVGANTTNYVLSTGADLTNLIYMIGANCTNFTYSIGANTTNYANSIFTSLSNLIAGVGGSSVSNLYGGTNISVRVQGGTNYIDTVGELNNWSSFSTNVIGNVASNRVTVAAGTNVVVATNGSGGVMTYTVSAANTADTWYLTNITVFSNAFFNNVYITNLTVISNAYINNLYATNLTIISNSTFKGNTYISQTNFVNYIVSSNIAEFGSNITVAGTGMFDSVVITNQLFQTNRTVTIATNTTSLTLDFLGKKDWYDCPTLMETNLVLSPTNLIGGREIWVFFTAANGNYDVTVTNTAATDIRWNLNGPTNGSTSFTVTNGARAELCITCRTNNVLHAVYGQYR